MKVISIHILFQFSWQLTVAFHIILVITVMVLANITRGVIFTHVAIQIGAP